jgi:hypothetical protein
LFVGRDKMFLAIPSYYYGSVWYSALGIGYKF